MFHSAVVFKDIDFKLCIVTIANGLIQCRVFHGKDRI